MGLATLARAGADAKKNEKPDRAEEFGRAENAEVAGCAGPNMIQGRPQVSRMAAQRAKVFFPRLTETPAAFEILPALAPTLPLERAASPVSPSSSSLKRSASN